MYVTTSRGLLDGYLFSLWRSHRLSIVAKHLAETGLAMLERSPNAAHASVSGASETETNSVVLPMR